MSYAVHPSVCLSTGPVLLCYDWSYPGTWVVNHGRRVMCFSTTLSSAVSTRDRALLSSVPIISCVLRLCVCLVGRLSSSLVNSPSTVVCACHVQRLQTLMRHLVATSVLWGRQHAGLVTRQPSPRRTCVLLGAALSRPPTLDIYCRLVNKCPRHSEIQP